MLKLRRGLLFGRERWWMLRMPVGSVPIELRNGRVHLMPGRVLLRFGGPGGDVGLVLIGFLCRLRVGELLELQRRLLLRGDGRRMLLVPVGPVPELG